MIKNKIKIGACFKRGMFCLLLHKKPFMFSEFCSKNARTSHFSISSTSSRNSSP